MTKGFSALQRTIKDNYEEIEQYINGVIKYIPITNSKRLGLMTEIVEKWVANLN